MQRTIELIATATLALIQTDAAPPKHTAPTPEVVVVAPRSPTQLGEQVRAASSEAPSGELARWRTAICPRSEGLSPPLNSYFEARVRDIAQRVGAPVAPRKCTPNAIIAFTTDSSRVSRLFARLSREQWGSHQASLGDGAVSVFTGSQQMPADGTSGDVACPLNRCFLAVNHATASRVVSNVIAGIDQCVAVVNTKTLQGVKLGALSGAIAMNCLAQLKPASLWSESVSKNISQDDLSTDLAEADEKYLRALYSLKGDVNATLTTSEITHDMRAGGKD